MRNILLVASCALTLLSCSKDSEDEVANNDQTVLLKRITATTITGFSYTVLELTYNDKQLIKAELDKDGENGFDRENQFKYDSQGKLIGVDIIDRLARPRTQKADIKMIGNLIDQISFTFDTDSIETWNFSYKNGLLDEERVDYPKDKMTIATSYLYDNTGNNIKEQRNVAYISSNGYTSFISRLYTLSSFDDKKTVASALPYWIYFRTYGTDWQMLGKAFGKHNPLRVKPGNENVSDIESYTIKYSYNEYGYPSTMTLLDYSGDIGMYQYEYIIIK